MRNPPFFCASALHCVDKSARFAQNRRPGHDAEFTIMNRRFMAFFTGGYAVAPDDESNNGRISDTVSLMKKFTIQIFAAIIAIACGAAFIVYSSAASAAATPRFAKMKAAYNAGDFKTARSLYGEVIKHEVQAADEAALIYAELTPDTQEALALLQKTKKKRLPRALADRCSLQICDILYLKSDWQGLKAEANAGYASASGAAKDDFLFYLSKATFYLQQYDESAVYSARLEERYRSHELYPAVRLQSLFLAQKRGVGSANYALALKETYYELQGGGSEVSCLYLLARHFEYKNELQNAYSLYKDIITKYPRSPEALLAQNKIDDLASRRISYKANVLQTIKSEPDSVIQSLRPFENTATKNDGSYYALSIGPFYNLEAAKKLKADLVRDFDNVIIIKGDRRFSIYIGRESSSEQCMTLKIRLAEEFGYNGDIIHVGENDEATYIHSE